MLGVGPSASLQHSVRSLSLVNIDPVDISAAERARGKGLAPLDVQRLPIIVVTLPLACPDAYFAGPQHQLKVGRLGHTSKDRLAHSN